MKISASVELCVDDDIRVLDRADKVTSAKATS